MKLNNPLERVREAIQSGMGQAITEGRVFAFIQVDQIDPNPYQPRQKINGQALEELRQSIEQAGVIEPIVVRRKEDRYEIISGERRWRACCDLELKEIPCVLRNVSDEEAFRLALVENLQRNALTPLEEALAFQRLLDLKIARNQADVGKILGIRQQRVSDKLRLLELPTEVRELFEDPYHEHITQKHGEFLLKLKDSAMIRMVAQKITQESLSTRETLHLVQKLLSQKPADSFKKTRYQQKVLVIRTRHGFSLKVNFDKRHDSLEDILGDLVPTLDKLRKDFSDPNQK